MIEDELNELKNELNQIKELLLSKSYNEKTDELDIRSEDIQQFIYKYFTYVYQFTRSESKTFTTLFEGIYSKINAIKETLLKQPTITPKEFRNIIIYIDLIKTKHVFEILTILKNIQLQLSKRETRLFPVELFKLFQDFDDLTPIQRKESIITLQQPFLQYKQNLQKLDDNVLLLSEISPLYYEPVMITDEDNINIHLTSNMYIDLTNIYVGLTPYPLTFYIQDDTEYPRSSIQIIQPLDIFNSDSKDAFYIYNKYLIVNPDYRGTNYSIHVVAKDKFLSKPYTFNITENPFPSIYPTHNDIVVVL